MAIKEKQHGNRQHALGTVPSTDGLNDPAPYDTVSQEKTDDEAQKKDEGSMRDYLVSDSRLFLSLNYNNITDTVAAHLPLFGPP